jgi:hypothetical protein
LTGAEILTLKTTITARLFRTHQIEGGKKRLMQMFLDGGADVNAQGGEFGNALQAASLGGYENIEQLLLTKGADVRIASRNREDAMAAFEIQIVTL